MAFKGNTNQPGKFADLLSVLNNAKIQQTNPPLFQLLSQIIKRSNDNAQVVDTTLIQQLGNITSIDLSVTTINGKVNILAALAILAAEPITGVILDNFPDARELLAGTAVTFDDTVANQRTINVTAGTGDVVGPASSNDNTIVLFDGITGKLLKDSGVDMTLLLLFFNAIQAATFLTVDDQTATFGNSRRVLAGDAIAYDDTVPNVRTANVLVDGVTVTINGSNELVAAGGGGSVTIDQGTFASLPAVPAVGDVYFFTDSVYPFARCNSAGVWSFFLAGKLITRPPVIASWAAVNAGGQLVGIDNAGTLFLTITHNASTNMRGYSIAQPATPYSWRIFLQAGMVITNSEIVGAYFYDGTAFMGIELLTQTGVKSLRVQRWTSVTTVSTTAITIGQYAAQGFTDAGMWIRLTNSGTVLTFENSFNGIDWFNLFSENVGVTLTPTHILIAGECAAGSGTIMGISVQAAGV